jgi:hypothetical protein
VAALSPDSKAYTARGSVSPMLETPMARPSMPKAPGRLLRRWCQPLSELKGATRETHLQMRKPKTAGKNPS